MRGKVKFKMPLIFIYRITPAYAGKSLQRFFLMSVQRDHPRLCGEKRFSKNCGHVDMGITPAYAGKSRRGTKPD